MEWLWPTFGGYGKWLAKQDAMTEECEAGSPVHLPHEVAPLDRGKGHARIMRRGKVGEWKEWMTPQLERYFTTPELCKVASFLGYSLG
ncbi:hypothetical protein AB0J43_26730 [Nonomuraea fuscirosea]